MPLIVVVVAGQLTAADLEHVRVSDDRRSFVLADSARKFVPWGFNYDHQADSGRLLEEYWDKEWTTIEGDFREMKQLGANVVRVHLQFGAFMDAADKANRHSLEQLERLVVLAEQTGLYLDVTGLGCYHKKDVPGWYDKLSETQRWDAQAVFWEAVASRCTRSPAIFCYDLMNEPIVPGGRTKRDDWLGPAFAGKHFVQFVSLELRGRPRHAVARKWISKLVAAIRKHDRRHLVTVGLVPWSLDRPGLTSGFVPRKIAGELDFVSVHIYPKNGKVAEALETLKGFAAVGKPVVIEETFPLKCDAKQLGRFFDLSREHATGWIGFYWGKTPAEYRKGKTIQGAITLSWLELFQEKRPQPKLGFGSVACEGIHRHHVQGICTNEKDAVYWSFTTTLVKTDRNGKLLKKIPVRSHHGDLCHHRGRIYVAVNFGNFNDPAGKADSWVYVYDADDLSLLAKHQVPQVFHGAGGIAHHDGQFIVVGGLPQGVEENYAYQYDRRFQFIRKHVIRSGYTRLGIQTAAFADGHWWFGCYGTQLLKVERSFKLVGKYAFDCGVGIVGVSPGNFLIGRGGGNGEKRSAKATIAVEDKQKGLRFP